MNRPSENQDRSDSTSNEILEIFSRRIPLFQRLNVAGKIGVGYSIAIGVGVLGTIMGTFIGDYYQYEAAEIERRVDEEVELLVELKSSMLLARSHQQQFIALLEKPQDLKKEYNNFLEDVEETNENWTELDSFTEKINQQYSGKDDINYNISVSKLLKANEKIPKAYFAEVDKLIKEIDILNLKSPEQIQAAQKRLLTFTNSSLAKEFDDISSELSELAEAAEEEDEKADKALAQAQITRRSIVFTANLISIALAIFLGFYTTKTIASPIKQLTYIAEEITRKSNFDLQIYVTTNDEVGVLANSLNELILRVRKLLREKAKAQENLEIYNQSLETKVKERTQELEDTLKELQYTQTQLIQKEKMSSLGQLVGGIAHEINNPVNFIHANLEYTRDYIQDLLQLVEIYQEEYPNPTKVIEEEIENIDLKFLQNDLPNILNSMQTGSERIRKIVTSLRTFSRLDEAAYKIVDIHENIESTLMIVQSRLEATPKRCEIEIIKNYGKLPLVECYAGELNQVFMNLLVNAIDILEEKIALSDNSPFFIPQITISTKNLNSERISIHFADNGLGMSETVSSQIFNPFFTTKPVGKGTGLGLAVSYQVVVDRHHGEFNLSSIPGEGTEFAIEIPVKLEVS